MTILCSSCNCLWRDGTVKYISIFYCDLAGKLGGDWIPPNLLCKPKAIVQELYIHSHLGFHFLLVPLLILQSWLLVSPLPSFVLYSVIKDWGHACVADLVLKKYFKLVSLLMFTSDNFWPYSGDAAGANGNSDERIIES